MSKKTERRPNSVTELSLESVLPSSQQVPLDETQHVTEPGRMIDFAIGFAQNA